MRCQNSGQVVVDGLIWSALVIWDWDILGGHGVLPGQFVQVPRQLVINWFIMELIYLCALCLLDAQHLESEETPPAEVRDPRVQLKEMFEIYLANCINVLRL